MYSHGAEHNTDNFAVQFQLVNLSSTSSCATGPIHTRSTQALNIQLTCLFVLFVSCLLGTNIHIDIKRVLQVHAVILNSWGKTSNV